MPQATLPTFERIALVFDFDLTLAEDSYAALLRRCDRDPDRFGRERVDPLVAAGWEKILARSYALLQLSREGFPVDGELLRQVGRTISLFDGVEGMFARVRSAAVAIVPDIEVEFYLLTSGFVEIARASPIADEFTAMWGNEFHQRDGTLEFVSKIVPHGEKPRYLQLISKGLDEKQNNPSSAYRSVPQDELHVPLSQMIYLGDGASDIPAFELMNGSGGIAIGIAVDGDQESWRHRHEMQQGRRLQNVAPPDYREGAQLLRSLLLATEAICKRIALRRLSGSG